MSEVGIESEYLDIVCLAQYLDSQENLVKFPLSNQNQMRIASGFLSKLKLFPSCVFLPSNSETLSNFSRVFLSFFISDQNNGHIKGRNPTFIPSELELKEVMLEFSEKKG